jgi:hypothetical protein
VKIKGRRAGRFEAEQVVVVNLVRNVLQVILQALLSGEVHVLAAGERRQFPSGFPLEGFDALMTRVSCGGSKKNGGAWSI